MLHEQFQHQNVANSIENERFELKNAANTLETQLPAPKCYKFHQNVANSIENERFQVQDIARTVEMAASSSQMLQIARKTGRKADPPKVPKTEKKSQHNSGSFPKRCFLCFPKRFFPENMTTDNSWGASSELQPLAADGWETTESAAEPADDVEGPEGCSCGGQRWQKC